MKTAGQLLAEALKNKAPLDAVAMQNALQSQADQFNAEAPAHLRAANGILVSVEISQSSSRDPGFTIRDVAGSEPSITCHACNRTSYHPTDIEKRYCGHCYKFHEGGRGR